MTLAQGTRLGTYEIVAPLGAGGMGEVYRAKDLRLGREVALKVLPADVASHPDRLARFEREAPTVAGLSHRNIVVLHSVEDDGDVRFLTMELVEGQSLDKHVTPGGLPLARVLDLGIALSDALTSAHEKGVIHRDLKPANVMLTREGRVKVVAYPTIPSRSITVMIVASIVAIATSLLPVRIKPSAWQTEIVRPDRSTRPRATKTSPLAGARRFVLNSTLSTPAPGGVRLNAA